MIIVGVSGVTNGGKTTLAEALHKVLPRSYLLRQDKYFLPKDDKRHILIPQINHFNWDIMSSLDMDKMWEDIELILRNEKLSEEDTNETTPSKKNDLKPVLMNQVSKTAEQEVACIAHGNNVKVLIIEGFLVLNYKSIVDICHLKYHLTLNKEECLRRRNSRQYDPPDVPGYFELCVWPEYMKYKEEMLQTVRDVKVIDGTRNIESIFDEVLSDIVEKVETAA